MCLPELIVCFPTVGAVDWALSSKLGDAFDRVNVLPRIQPRLPALVNFETDACTVHLLGVLRGCHFYSAADTGSHAQTHTSGYGAVKTCTCM